MMEFIHKIPILTTVLSVVFAIQLARHWQTKGRPDYLFWWMVGVICYGLGTLTEAIVGLASWSEPVFKAWYVLGAMLGGFPLAQGSVFLMMRRPVARTMMWIVVSIILVGAVLTILSPVKYELVEPTRLTGKVLRWTGVRYMTPVINLYAFIFLVGGAVYSAWRYSRDAQYRTRFWGNVLIAAGGLLPGIGGSFTKFGYTEVLYVTELLGIILIYAGYRVMRQDKSLSIYDTQLVAK